MTTSKRRFGKKNDAVRRGGRPAEQVAAPNKKTNARGVEKK